MKITEQGAPIAATETLHRCEAAGARLAEAHSMPELAQDYAEGIHGIVNRTGVKPEDVEKVLAELATWDWS